MVEILSSVLSGGALSSEMGSTYHTWDRPVNTGHFFLALDVARFASPDDFLRRVDALLASIRAAAAPDAPVRFPGEIRGELAARHERTGIPLPRETVDALTRLAGELGVRAPWG
jgi:LDH2 family malate/lactate/ureidoglycolate dehydrogenase